MKKRLVSFVMAMVFCCGLSPAYAVEINNNDVETRYITSDGVVVRIIGDRHVAITEQDGFLVVDGEVTISLEDEPMESAMQYAYMDLEAASPEMQEKILEARKEIIFSEEWVADGYAMSVVDMRTGETVREIPVFSEVFPGWDLPVEKETIVVESRDIVL